MDKKFRGDHTRYGQTSRMSEKERLSAIAGRGGKGSGLKSRRTRKRQELLAEQERHAMDKPKPLEVVSDGDLTEIKKDPVWKTWLGKKRDWDAEDKEEKEMSRPIKCTSCGKTKPRILYENPLGKPFGICDECASPPTPGAPDPKWIKDLQNNDDTDENPKTSKKSYVTKPIPDSKGGKGSFQHCINANQDKHNPGGWCKQIERKIGKGRDEGEEEEVKISMYEKLRRIKDRLQSHNKAKKVPTKEVKLPQTKMTHPGDWWDRSKVGTNTGWDDDPMNKPSYFQARMEEERQKREKKKVEEPESDYYMDIGGNPQRKEKAIPFNPKKESSDTWNCDLCNMEIPNDSDADKRKKRHADFHVDESVQTGGRQRNWTFGDAKFTLGKKKADYFIEEIRSNIIYHNKILPLVGMIAGQVARGVGPAAKKIGAEVLSDVGEVAQGAMQGVGEEAEEE